VISQGLLYRGCVVSNAIANCSEVTHRFFGGSDWKQEREGESDQGGEKLSHAA
jgi:hypothetical protein